MTARSTVEARGKMLLYYVGWEEQDRMHMSHILGEIGSGKTEI